MPSAPSTSWAIAKVRAFSAVHELLVVLGDHAGAAAVGAVELDHLDVELGRDLAIEPCSSGVKPRETQPGQ